MTDAPAIDTAALRAAWNNVCVIQAVDDTPWHTIIPALLDRLAAAEAAARYCEQIDATPENQRETMLYDTLSERDALQAECNRLAARLAEVQAEIGAR